jgi:hypothetical protein
VAVAVAVTLVPVEPSRRRIKTGAVRRSDTLKDIRSGAAPAWTTSERLRPHCSAEWAAASVARAGRPRLQGSVSDAMAEGIEPDRPWPDTLKD